MAKPRIDDVCARPEPLPENSTTPLAPPLFPTAVWECAGPEQADQVLSGSVAGYVYQRDAHPNADMLAAKCRALHGCERALIVGSGMAALSVALLSQLEPGDGLLVSEHVYGKTRQLFEGEARRWGVEVTRFDSCSVDACRQTISRGTRLVVIETISNPRLRVADVASLAECAQEHGAQLLVDNTFATPVLMRPLEWGADWVMESLTKLINGHSDVVLGMLGGREAGWPRVNSTAVTWGFNSSPWDCWLALRGIASMHLRVERASENAFQAARWLAQRPEVQSVDYPGLEQHPDHRLAERQFGGRYGSIVTFHVHGGTEAARRFIAAARSIPFCPSLGDISTTVSHPASTSHRGLTDDQRRQLGIDGGTLRLSCGVESADTILETLDIGLHAARGG